MSFILVIDDDRGMCWALEKALHMEEEGIKVLTATSGAEGLSVFSSRLDDIKLILLDVKLNDADGLDLLRQIKQKSASIPVLIMTGYSSLSKALEAIERGAAGYLTKPLNMSGLRETVRKMLIEGGYAKEGTGCCGRGRAVCTRD